MKRNRINIMSVLIAALLLAACSPSQTPTPAPVLLSFVFENNDCTYTGPRPIPAGTEITASLEVRDMDIPGPIPVVYLSAVTLNAGATVQDLEDDFITNISGGHTVSVGAVEVTPGASKQFSVRTTTGPIYFACFYAPIEENFHLIGPVEVAGTTPF